MTLPPKSSEMTLKAVHLSKEFGHGAHRTMVLHDVDLSVDGGQFVAICGPSGSGKSTLLTLLGGLDRPTHGSVWIGDTEISRLGDGRRAALRNSRLGFVFQSFQLLPALTARENVAIPALIAGRRADAYARADQLLEAVGLGGFALGAPNADRRAYEMSGGEQQRVAIARALVNGPSIVLADEPTGNLDQENGASVLDILTRATVSASRTLLVVTHDESIAERADMVVRLVDGRVVGVSARAPT